MKFDRVENGVAVFTHETRFRCGFRPGDGPIPYTETLLGPQALKLRIRNLRVEAPHLNIDEELAALGALGVSQEWWIDE